MRVHISLPATNLEKSQAFYSELFAASPSKVKEDYLNFRLDEPAIHLSLIESNAAHNNPQQHFGIELPSEDLFDSWRERLVDNDSTASSKTESEAKVLIEDGAKCCYAQGNKLWLADPDGHRWEIWHRTGEFDALTQPEEKCCA